MDELPPTYQDPRFYQAELYPGRVPEAFSDLLQSYSNIEQPQQEAHIVAVRNEAYESHHYPCLGRFRFVDLDLASHPVYHTYVLPTLTSSTSSAEQANTSQDTNPEPLFLDLGTCLGQDIRKLIHDGVPVSQVYGADINPFFIDAGYSLFRDEHKLPRSHFITNANVLAPMTSEQDITDNGLDSLHEKLTIIHATAIFHLFDYEQQKQVARRCLRMLKKQPLDSQSDPTAGTSKSSDHAFTLHVPGSKYLIVGGQAGSINATETQRRFGGKAFRHNEHSWRQMWDEVVQEHEWKTLGTRVVVESHLVVRGFGEQDKVGGNGNGEGDGKTRWDSKVVGRAEDGWRWHQYAVWIEFRDTTAGS